mmetsp:Transcript_61088/g.162233  ORF Transcript_61088/g.162233 Transcript_61088/m.162233 type:complete len:87 (-) Transcript_61088:70-330(-)
MSCEGRVASGCPRCVAKCDSLVPCTGSHQGDGQTRGQEHQHSDEVALFDSVWYVIFDVQASTCFESTRGARKPCVRGHCRKALYHT